MLFSWATAPMSLHPLLFIHEVYDPKPSSLTLIFKWYLYALVIKQDLSHVRCRDGFSLDP